MDAAEFIVATSSNTVKDLAARTDTVPDENRAPALAIVTWLLISVSILVVAARCCTKVKYARQLFWDDGVMILAVLTGLVHAIFVQLAINDGYGRHIVHLGMERILNIVMFNAISMLFGSLSPMLGRLAFCCTLLFLIKTDPRMRAWHVYVCMVLQVAVNVTGLVVTFTQCGKHLDFGALLNRPAEKQVNYCSDPTLQMYMKYGVGSWNTATDLYLAILPAILINHTRISLKAKLGVGCLLCLSVVAMLASGARTYEGKLLQDVVDYTWALPPFTMWASIELNTIILSASIPFLRPLFRRQKPPGRTLRGETWPQGAHVSLGSVQFPETRRNWPLDTKRNTSSTSTLARTLSNGITKTTNIEISYHSPTAPVIHANIVGLGSGADDFAYPDSRDNTAVARRRCW